MEMQNDSPLTKTGYNIIVQLLFFKALRWNTHVNRYMDGLDSLAS